MNQNVALLVWEQFFDENSLFRSSLLIATWRSSSLKQRNNNTCAILKVNNWGKFHWIPLAGIEFYLQAVNGVNITNCRMTFYDFGFVLDQNLVLEQNRCLLLCYSSNVNKTINAMEQRRLILTFLLDLLVWKTTSSYKTFYRTVRNSCLSHLGDLWWCILVLETVLDAINHLHVNWFVCLIFFIASEYK